LVYLLNQQFGLLAKSIVEGFCPVGSKLLVETNIDRDDKFGRILGTLWVENNTLNLNQFLVDERYAVAYLGQNKDDVAEAHLANYAYLTENGKI